MPWTVAAIKKKTEIIQAKIFKLNFIIYEKKRDYLNKEEHQRKSLAIIKQCHENMKRKMIEEDKIGPSQFVNKFFKSDH